MKRLLARLESIEATGVLDIDVNWVNGNQRIPFHSVRTASADRVREMAAPRRHLALVCSCTRRGATPLDQAVDMYGKLLDRNRKLVEGPSRRHAQGATACRRPGSSSAIVGSAPCCSIPASATTSCGPRLLSIVRNGAAVPAQGMSAS